MSPVHQSLAMQTMLSDLATPNPTNPRSQGWLAKKVQIFSLTFVLISSLHAEVIGDGSVPFYLRRPQSRIRINMRAHIGFCGRWTIVLSSICPSFSFFPNLMFLCTKPTQMLQICSLIFIVCLCTLPSFMFLSLLRLPALLHLLPPAQVRAMQLCRISRLLCSSHQKGSSKVNFNQPSSPESWSLWSPFCQPFPSDRQYWPCQIDIDH